MKRSTEQFLVSVFFGAFLGVLAGEMIAGMLWPLRHVLPWFPYPGMPALLNGAIWGAIIGALLEARSGRE